MEKESQERLKISSPWQFAEGCDSVDIAYSINTRQEIVGLVN